MLRVVTRGSRTAEAPSAMSCVSSGFAERGTLFLCSPLNKTDTVAPSYLPSWEPGKPPHREGNTGKSFGFMQLHDENSKPRGWRVWEGEPWREFTRSLEMVIQREGTRRNAVDHVDLTSLWPGRLEIIVSSKG